ncbi:hypothetical protein B0O99DRAFT_696456 [Bisporella sp. PMI_857]|nr:hypothetical protein B0O99DRAFT_696456 [Bisporella sp. PMI_857]
MDTHKEAQQIDDDGLHLNRDYEGIQAVPAHQLLKHDDGATWYRDGEAASRENRTILGLSVAVFWVVIGVFVLVLAGGIGTGVGVSLSSQKDSSLQLTSTSSISTSTLVPASGSQASTSSTSSTSPSSTTPSQVTSSTAQTGGPSPIISTPCISDPSSNNAILSAHDATGGNPIAAFTLKCNTNYPAGVKFGNPNVLDLYILWVPDMASCINACAKYNQGYAVAQGSPKCVVATVVRKEGDHCWLKSGTGINDTTTSGGAPIDSAILISS